MSVTGPAQSAVDWVNPVNWGPWGPLAVTQGRPQVCHVSGGRRHVAGDAKHGGGPRTSSDFAYGQPFRARAGAFERAEQRASNSGGGVAGVGWNRRRRRGQRRSGFVRRRKRRGSVLLSKRGGWGGSTWCGESNGYEPVTKRSPETRRRRAPRRCVRRRCES